LPTHLHAASRRELAEADLILVQDIQDWEGYPLREAIPDGIETIAFPPLRLPRSGRSTISRPGRQEAHDREWPNLTFLYQDGLLGRLRREIPDKEARFRAYRGLELDGVVNYVRLHDSKVGASWHSTAGSALRSARMYWRISRRSNYSIRPSTRTGSW